MLRHSVLFALACYGCGQLAPNDGDAGVSDSGNDGDAASACSTGNFRSTDPSCGAEHLPRRWGLRFTLMNSPPFSHAAT